MTDDLQVQTEDNSFLVRLMSAFPAEKQEVCPAKIKAEVSASLQRLAGLRPQQEPALKVSTTLSCSTDRSGNSCKALSRSASYFCPQDQTRTGRSRDPIVKSHRDVLCGMIQLDLVLVQFWPGSGPNSRNVQSFSVSQQNILLGLMGWCCSLVLVEVLS